MNPIEHDILIQHGKPVIASTRTPVNIILGSLAGGMSYDEILNEYGITRNQVQACLAYAAEFISSETVISLSGS